MLRRCLLLLPLAALAGCACPTAKPAGPVPPPISIGQQVQALNQRATAIPALKDAGGHVHVRWTDPDGTHDHDFDGTLLLRQTLTPGSAPQIDMLLEGRVAGSTVLQLGANQQAHWMIVQASQPPRAYLGRIGGPGADKIPLHAEDVAKLLAIAWLYEVRTPGPGGVAQRLAMTVHDTPEPPTNDLMVLRIPADRPAWVEREDLVNRRTGHVEQVRLYHPDGTLRATATLRDYQDAAYDPSRIAPEQRTTVLLPTRVHIDYPDPNRPATIDLSFHRLTITRLGDGPFETPDFKELGITPIDVDKSDQTSPPPAPTTSDRTGKKVLLNTEDEQRRAAEMIDAVRRKPSYIPSPTPDEPATDH